MAAEGRRFADRRSAGRELAAALAERAERQPVVAALPRGGVPVGYEVALALGAPLDVALVRKLGAPSQPELAIGAIGEGDWLLIDKDALRDLRISDEQLDALIARERSELGRRRQAYRAGEPMIDMRGRLALLIDDGIATGATAVTAGRILRAAGAESVELAVPVGPPGIEARLEAEFDRITCLRTPRPYLAVGEAYEDFGQTSDEEVIALLQAARRRE